MKNHIDVLIFHMKICGAPEWGIKMNKMTRNEKLLLACIAVPLGVGILSSLFSGGGMKEFAALRQPPLAPPGWIFPLVWTVLYVLMGLASYLVLISGAEQKDILKALTAYGYQLIANFLWPVFFFDFGWYLFSFLWLVLLWWLILVTAKRFYRISKPAAYLMIPYLVWVTFAGYLNLGIWWLS